MEEQKFCYKSQLHILKDVKVVSEDSELPELIGTLKCFVSPLESVKAIKDAVTVTPQPL